jgi:hypothetical protein
MTAAPGHPQLLAIGEPVTATLTGGAAATVTLLGPEITPAPAASGPPDHGTAAFTLRAVPVRGAVALSVKDFTGRDDQGNDLIITPAGPALTSTGTGTVTLRMTAAVRSGAAQLTWRPGGAVIALWTFNAELD